MKDTFVTAKPSKLHWIDQVLYLPAGVMLCVFVPVGALISGETSFWGLSVTTCVLIGIGFLIIAVIERLAVICVELQTMTFLVKNLFKEKDAEDLSVSLYDLDRMRRTVRQALGANDDETV
jgi:hypothetical protein